MLEENLKPILEQLRSRNNPYKERYGETLQALKKAETVWRERSELLRRRKTIRNDNELNTANEEYKVAYQEHTLAHIAYFTEIHNHAREILGEDFRNMVSDIKDLTYICTLPYDDWRAVIDPVLGNWFLDQYKDCKPQTEYQIRLQEMLIGAIKGARFDGSSFIKDINRNNDQFPNFEVIENKVQRATRCNPTESDLICKPLREACEDIVRFYYESRSKDFDNMWFYTDPASGKRTKCEVDLGSLYERTMRFHFLVS